MSFDLVGAKVRLKSRVTGDKHIYVEDEFEAGAVAGVESYFPPEEGWPAELYLDLGDGFTAMVNLDEVEILDD